MNSFSNERVSNPHHFRPMLNCKDFELEQSSDVEDIIKWLITTCPILIVPPFGL